MASTSVTGHATIPTNDRDKSVAWYSKDIQWDLGPARKLLEEYSGVPPDQVVSHIVAVREKAWEVHPYPCIGDFRFLHLSISQHPLYPTVLSRLKESSQILLDIGCCFGQDIRCLVADGVPSENLFAADLRLEFLELGYELFKDKGTLKTQFLEGDIFDVNEEGGKELRRLNGEIDIIHAASFLHLFTWDEQVKAGIQMVQFLKPTTMNALILGRQTASTNPGVKPRLMNATGNTYRHNPESFQRLWNEIGERTGTRWRSKVDMYEATGWRRPRDGKETDDRLMRYEIHKI